MRDYISPEEYAETQRANAIIDACYGLGQEQRADGYQNMLTKYGTKADNSTSFRFVADVCADTYTLSVHYRFNGLFTKIIDLPAEEAVSKGFKLNINDDTIEREIMRKCNDLGWEEHVETAIKWARLYGGSVIVMLINDGRGIDEPLNYRTIRGIDELRVYESPIVSPIDYVQSATTDPDLLYISSMDGTFVVHTSRCLLFRNGRLPEMATDWQERMFGCPEYDRIKTSLRECITTHGYAPRMLERAIQSVFSIKGLSDLLSTADGEDRAVKRLELIDLARSMFNSVAIDADGESFDFKTAPYSGTKEIIDSTCNMLSAVTNIPQALLFGSSPQGMDATGMSDLENYYNYVGQIQKRMVRNPLNKLLKIVMQALVRTGRIDDYPDYELEFNPLWSLTEQEQANVDQIREQIKLAKAQTSQIYSDIGALDPNEIRSALAKEGEYDVETILDNVSDEDLFESILEKSSEQEPPQAPINQDGEGEEPAQWRTINGNPIPLDENGNAIGGQPKALGKKKDPKKWDFRTIKSDFDKLEKEFEKVKGDWTSPKNAAIYRRLQSMDRLITLELEDSDPDFNDHDTLLTYRRKVRQLLRRVARKDEEDVPTAAAVIVLHDGKLLCGVRSDNDQICGPGGHIEDGEAPIQAAIRETQEEFGITPVDLMYMGTQGENGEDTHCTAVYLCTSFSGTPKADGKEMHGALFLSPDTLDEQFGDNLFPPFADSLKMSKSAQIMQTLSMDISDGCGIIRETENRMDASQRLAYGLCKKYGIDTTGFTPSDCWEALKVKTGKSSADFYAQSGDPDSPKIRFNTASRKTFAKKLNEAKRNQPADKSWRVTGMDAKSLAEEHPTAKLHVTDGGSTIAIDNGDIVAVCVGSGDGSGGQLRGRDILAFAVKNGGDRLDSYVGNHVFYAKCGFEAVSRVAWNHDYDDFAKAQGWKAGRDDPEDIVFYKYVGVGKVKHVDRDSIKDIPYSKDYDAAREARDKEIE